MNYFLAIVGIIISIFKKNLKNNSEWKPFFLWGISENFEPINGLRHSSEKAPWLVYLVLFLFKPIC